MGNDVAEISGAWMCEASKRPASGEGRSDSEAKEMWDRSASTYSDSRYSELIGQIIGVLVTKKVISADRTVLDIGCGTGSFTRPLSKYSKYILGLDSSRVMLSVLGRKCILESIGNIIPYEADCRDMPGDLICDVTFSSLCPSMNSPEGILSMEEHARMKCSYISSANVSTGIESEIWSELGCDYSYNGYNTKYPYEYLTALGRDAELYYFEQRYDSKVRAEDMETKYVRLLSKYRSVSSIEREAVRKVISRHAVGGILNLKGSMRLGLLIWTPTHK